MNRLDKLTQNFITIAQKQLGTAQRLILLPILLFAHLSYSNGTPAASEQLFAAATSAAYQDIIREQKSGVISADLEQIIKSSEAAITAQSPTLAMATIVRNMPSILQQVTSASVQKIAALALSLHGTDIAQALLTEAKNQGDNFSEARISFEIAKYDAEQAQWGNVITLLKNPGIIESLEKEDAAEANLLIGNALQQQKKHREAMVFYEKIKSSSSHYRLAQLNLATANIRQDWWSDAHLAIHNALKVNGSKRDELDYRLYTVLGYSQIQFGFYRDARESFRNVALKSSYSNRALLGLGMAALHQEDFIGALSAFNHLRDKQERDISIAESYLLGAFTLRQLGQQEAALAAYQEAVAYYQQLNSKQSAELTNLETKPIDLQLTKTIFIRPESSKNKQLNELLERIVITNDLLAQPLSGNRVSALTNIKASLEKKYRLVAKKLLVEEQKSIESYLSQSRFGLATLYDGN
ncbi:MAG TPA: hypothetical protein VLC79_03390 [Cellvibrio sp.]|nr:hypothetical protein [Cellvibrio sp.]